MRNWLYGRYVVLTGASGGIGRQLCKLLIEKYGAKVIGVGRNEEKMRSLSDELSKNALSLSYSLFDVSDKTAWQTFRQELSEKQIRPILLINNAGMFPSFQKTLNVPSETVEKIMEVNYFSVVYGVEALADLLQGEGKNKPAIVNVASSAALCSVVGASAYSASKAAIKGFTEALQLEEKGKKYVGIVYPGTTATDLFRNDEHVQGSALDMIAMPAEKMAKKIARAILKKKKRAVLGWDAKFMNICAKIAPVKGLAFIRWVLKTSKTKVYADVFTGNAKK